MNMSAPQALTVLGKTDGVYDPRVLDALNQVRGSRTLEPDTLAVRIADDGRGFDPSHTPEGAGVRNIRDRIEDLGGTFVLASSPGHGTVLTISMPWPAAADGRL